jgi:hypothetical protein
LSSSSNTISNVFIGTSSSLLQAYLGKSINPSHTPGHKQHAWTWSKAGFGVWHGAKGKVAEGGLKIALLSSSLVWQGRRHCLKSKSRKTFSRGRSNCQVDANSRNPATKASRHEFGLPLLKLSQKTNRRACSIVNRSSSCLFVV